MYLVRDVVFKRILVSNKKKYVDEVINSPNTIEIVTGIHMYHI